MKMKLKIKHNRYIMKNHKSLGIKDVLLWFMYNTFFQNICHTNYSLALYYKFY